MDTSVEVLQKLNMELPWDPDVWLLRVRLKDAKPAYHRDWHTHAYCSTVSERQDTELT